MRPEAEAGAVRVADDLALAHVLALADREALLMRVARGEPVAVVDAGVVPVAAARRLRLREHHGTVGRRVDGRATRDPDVDARMAALPCALLAERRRYGAIHRPDEARGADLPGAGAPREGRSGRHCGRARGLRRGRRLGGLDLRLDLALDG